MTGQRLPPRLYIELRNAVDADEEIVIGATDILPPLPWTTDHVTLLRQFAEELIEGLITMRQES